MSDHADDLMFREIGTKPPDGRTYKCGHCGKKFGTSEAKAVAHVEKCVANIFDTEAIKSPAVLEDEWQPIETAPKTGEKFLVYRPAHDGDYIPVVGEDYWGSNMFNPEGCWMRSRSDCPPTHWMPLPKPPKGEEE